jgi:hypothetical protein
MFNLYEILRSAHGGQALEHLASQFNITPEEADAAVKAILPELSGGFLRQASEPAGFGSVMSTLGGGQYRAAFADPAAAQASALQSGDYLSEILGSRSAQEQIVLRASSASGISQDILAQMLPVIVSTIFGGLTKSLENQGFGGILGQLANAAGQGRLGPVLGQILGGSQAPASPPRQPAFAPSPAGGAGGLGSILGQILGSGHAPSAAQGQASGLGGILGSILGSLTRKPSAGPSTGPAAAAPGTQTPGFDSASIQAALDALKKLLQPGTPPSSPPPAEAPPAPAREMETPAPQRQQTDIGAELDRILGKHPD